MRRAVVREELRDRIRAIEAAFQNIERWRDVIADRLGVLVADPGIAEAFADCGATFARTELLLQRARRSEDCLAEVEAALKETRVGLNHLVERCQAELQDSPAVQELLRHESDFEAARAALRSSSETVSDLGMDAVTRFDLALAAFKKEWRTQYAELEQLDELPEKYREEIRDLELLWERVRKLTEPISAVAVGGANPIDGDSDRGGEEDELP